MDLDLKKLSDVCPKQVSDYFLLRRVINRKQYEMIREGGFMNAYSNIHKNIDEVDTDQKIMLSLFESDDLQTVCTSLKNYNKLLAEK